MKPYKILAIVALLFSCSAALWAAGGKADYPTISQCASTVEVSGSANVGGISGNASAVVVAGCASSGNVSGTSGVGGIVGTATAATVTHSISSGNATGESNAGGICGINDASTVSNCFYDSQMSTAASGEATGKPTAEMTGSQLFDDSENWQETANLYPRPKSIANTPTAIVAATPVFLQNGENMSNVRTDFTVGTLNDVVWTAQGNKVNIAGGNAALVRTGDEVLSASLGNATKKVKIKTEVPLVAGTIDGTQSICSGSSATLSSVTAASGSGSVAYQWQKLVEGNWQNIANATAAGYTTENLTATTTFRRQATDESNETAATNEVTVTVNPLPTGAIEGDLEVCEGSATTLTAPEGVIYKWNTGQATPSITVNPVTTSEYDVVVTNEYGCEAKFNTEVVVKQPTYSVDVQQHCNSFTWIDGKTYTESNNTATFTLTNAAGCDSVVTLNLTINQPADTTLYASICAGETYSENGFDVSTAGKHILHLQTINGCDSVVTLNLTINQSLATSFAATACNKYVWNGVTYDTSGSYKQTFTAACGCDSVVTLNLTINQSLATNFAATACNEYVWNDKTYTESGVYYQTFTAACGCDSVVTLNLTINQSLATSFAATACNKYVWNGVTYDTSGSYKQTFTAACGCDSVVTLDLTINQSLATNFAATACNKYVWNDVTYDTSGSYKQTFTAACGCDSVVTLDLTINQSLATSFAATACNKYVWNDVTYDTSGSYKQTFTAACGCDSVVTLDLTINPSLATSFAATACKEYVWNDKTYTESGVYYQTFTAACGCDSVVTLDLTINPQPELSDIVGEAVPLCEAQNIIYQTTDIDDCVYTWTVPTGATIASGNGTNQIAVNFGKEVEGEITVMATSKAGCESVAKQLIINTADCPERFGIFIKNGRITCTEEGMRIFTLTGTDVTLQNGTYHGVYLVKVGDRSYVVQVKNW